VGIGVSVITLMAGSGATELTLAVIVAAGWSSSWFWEAGGVGGDTSAWSVGGVGSRPTPDLSPAGGGGGEASAMAERVGVVVGAASCGVSAVVDEFETGTSIGLARAMGADATGIGGVP